jgi:hypothetical protein
MNRMIDPKTTEPAPETEPESDSADRLFDVLWHGEVDGEAFDGDPADLW